MIHDNVNRLPREGACNALATRPHTRKKNKECDYCTRRSIFLSLKRLQNNKPHKISLANTLAKSFASAESAQAKIIPKEA